ncbi:MarR family transcriptional regulator [Asanoa sp. WMMD1127]|uniref:MarR family winged helix-turn-helix transcriptional regulator n=1 Tax=Asanoa sp. WMMD1127 TaxID=3016107 RepID=UPI002415C87C|nr:MarR family transcriptional regulator [Asanoa sp. WMMD1127]MDG4820411.1 MarR family transcriptional regulator [Asanoa sp. WMMD1127]
MPDHHAPDVAAEAAAVDSAAEALLSVWDTAREGATDRVSGSQLRAMLVMEEFEGINLRGLASSLGMILSSASRLCDRLVAAGMIERFPGRTDRREISLHLTRTGQRLLDELRSERRRRLSEVLGQMTPAARQALISGLSGFGDAMAKPDSDVLSA